MIIIVQRRQKRAALFKAIIVDTATYSWNDASTTFSVPTWPHHSSDGPPIAEVMSTARPDSIHCRLCCWGGLSSRRLGTVHYSLSHSTNRLARHYCHYSTYSSRRVALCHA